MFVDEVKIFVKAGSGGNGCISFRREKYVPRGGPDGGDGGNGGSVILVASSSIRTLLDFRYHPHYKAEDGTNGRGSNRKGKDAPDLILKVPAGTTVYKDSGVLSDLTKNNQRIVIAGGGRGGRGNRRFKLRNNRVPRVAEQGMPGEKTTVTLKLKLIADVGLVGYPNAGKSTLLSRISNARPKIAEYPFTTLAPNLGITVLNSGSVEGSFVVADIPGIIEGAHEGKGLGSRFLRHIERTGLLVHIVDISGYDGKLPEDLYALLRSEIRSYSRALASKDEILVANKMDLPGSETKLRELRAKIKKRIYPISAVTGKGVDRLLCAISKKIENYEKEKNCN